MLIIKTCIACFMLLAAAVVQAQIVSVDGAMVIVSAPPDVRPNVYEHNEEIRVFNERQMVSGPELSVDITDPGHVDSNGDLTPGTISAGTLVASYYIIFDPVGSSTRSAVGSVTFFQPVVGIMVGDDTLHDSNWLGDPGTTYPTSGSLTGLELGADTITLSADRRTVTVDITASTPGDRVRVVTSPVPEPATLAAFGGLLLLTRSRKGRRS